MDSLKASWVLPSRNRGTKLDPKQVKLPERLFKYLRARNSSHAQ